MATAGRLAPGSKSVANWQTQIFFGHNLHYCMLLRRGMSLPTLANSVGKLANSFSEIHGFSPPIRHDDALGQVHDHADRFAVCLLLAVGGGEDQANDPVARLIGL